MSSGRPVLGVDRPAILLPRGTTSRPPSTTGGRGEIPAKQVVKARIAKQLKDVVEG